MDREHLHRYFLKKEVPEVAMDLQRAGCAVEYAPGQALDGSPRSAIFRHSNIADCRSWKNPPLSIPEGAKTCVEISSVDPKTDELVRRLYCLNPPCVNCQQ